MRLLLLVRHVTPSDSMRRHEEGRYKSSPAYPTHMIHRSIQNWYSIPISSPLKTLRRRLLTSWWERDISSNNNSMSLTLWVIITTMDWHIERAVTDLLPQLQGVDQIVISHQISDPEWLPYDAEKLQKLHSNLVYTYEYTRGLSRSRNRWLGYITTDIVHICDDDLQYISWFEEVIKSTYTQYSHDIITFQSLDEHGKRVFDLEEWEYGWFKLWNIFSHGVVFRRDAIEGVWLRFDESFGLGTDIPLAEESIFLGDALKRWLTLTHVNRPIVIHPHESSGRLYDDAHVRGRITVMRRMYGIFWAMVAVFYFPFKYYSFYRKNYTPLRFFWISLQGLFQKYKKPSR